MQTLPYVYGFAPAVVVILILIWREAARKGLRREQVAAAMAACAAGAVIGSKVLMFDFHAAQYGEKTFLGAVAGGILTLALIARPLRFDARAFDVPVLPVLWGAAIGRIGCFLSGCCHGIESTLPWAVKYAHLPAAVHPTQLYESALDVCLALLLTRQQKRLGAPGNLALAGAAGIAMIRFVGEPLRATAVSSVGGLTVVQWSTLAVACAAVLALCMRIRRGATPVSSPPQDRASLAPAMVLAFVAVVALLAQDWLTPLETVLVTSVLLSGAAVVIHAAMPRVLYASPLIGATAFVPLAPGDSIPDGRPRTWIAIGGSAMFGGYDVRTEDCEGNTLTRQSHRYKIAGVSGEVYQQTRPGVGIGARITAFSGNDRAPRATRIGGEADPAIEVARDDRVSGATASATLDGKWLGATVGFGAGQWVWKDERPLRTPVTGKQMPVWALRVGKLTGLHSEFEMGTFTPAPAPGPMGRLMVGFGDTSGNRFRLGFEDRGSVLVTARIVSKAGFELEPYVSLGGVDEKGMIGMALKKRFYRFP